MIKVGDTFQFEKEILEDEVLQFAKLTGDFNPLHLEKKIVHGMLVASLTSKLVGMKLAGPGNLWVEQNFRFVSPAFIGDRLNFLVEVMQLSAATKSAKIRIRVHNKKSQTILVGEGLVILDFGKE